MHKPLNYKLFFLVFYSYILLGKILLILSCITIEGGSFISEQGITGYSNGATFFALAWSALSVLACFFFFKKACKKTKFINTSHLRTKTNSISYLTVTSIGAAWVIINGCIGLKFGFPLLGGVDRFYFWQSVPDTLKTIYGQVFLLSSILGALYAKSKKPLTRYIFICTLLIQILFGTKFSGLLFSTSLFLFFYYSCSDNPIKIKKFLLPSVFAALITSLIVLLQYAFIYGHGIEGALEEVFIRLALQAHLFWGSVNLYGTSGYPKLEILAQNLISAFSNTSEFSGMRQLMILVSGNLAYTRIEQGADYTMAYPGIVLISAGWLGVILFEVALSAYLATIAVLSALCYNKGYYIAAIPFTKLLIDIIGFYGLGNLGDILGPKPILYVTTGLISLLLYEQYKKPRYSNQAQ
jgi:hypothetical protein